MGEKPEQKARRLIDESLSAAGWIVQDRVELDLTLGRGIAMREFQMKSGSQLRCSEKPTSRNQSTPNPYNKC
jgi:hypothetical protein